MPSTDTLTHAVWSNGGSPWKTLHWWWVPWNYDPKDAYQAVGMGLIADVKQDVKLLPRFNRDAQTTNYNTPLQYTHIIHVNLISCHLSLPIHHSFHLLFTSPNCLVFLFILSHSCTFLHTKPLDNQFGCTLPLQKLHNNNFLCID